LRFRALSLIIILLLIAGSQIPTAIADTDLALDEDIVLLEPVVFGSMETSENYLLETNVDGFSVTDDGMMFTVSQDRMSKVTHGDTEVSLIAWGSDGTPLWSVITTHSDRKYYDVIQDGSYVYVVGRYESDILVEKYSFEGELVWNKTIDLGRIETGYEIFVMEEGTIVIGGAWWESEENWVPVGKEYLLLALSPSGQIKWAYGYERYPSPRCHSGYVYLTTGTNLQKLDSTGSTIWSVECTYLRLGCVKDDVIYTISSGQPIEYYEDPWGPSPSSCYTALSTTSWKSNTGEEVNSCNLRLLNATNQLYRSTRVDTAVGLDGSVWILMLAAEMGWYLICLNQTTESAAIYKILEHQWSWVCFELDDSGNAFIATTLEEYGYIVMKFSAEQIPTPTVPTSTSASTTTGTNGVTDVADSTMMALSFAAVVIIDAVLILVLKERWSVRS
jgi:hypothetical protein